MKNEGDASSRAVSLSLSRFHFLHLHHNRRAATLYAPGPPTHAFLGYRVKAGESKRVAMSCVEKIAFRSRPPKVKGLLHHISITPFVDFENPHWSILQRRLSSCVKIWRSSSSHTCAHTSTIYPTHWMSLKLLRFIFRV